MRRLSSVGDLQVIRGGRIGGYSLELVDMVKGWRENLCYCGEV